MTTVAASQVPKLQFFDPSTGAPLAGGLLFTYAAGTTTKQVTYSNPDTLTPNTNPIVLDSTGSCVCFLDATLQYEFTLSPAGDTDPPTNPIYSVDQVGYADILQGYAPLASPAFTGNPTAPTPTVGDNSTSIATTQFVDQAITNAQASPSLSGTPVAPTASPGTLTTQIATTAFVGAEIARAQSMQAFTSSGSWTVPTDVTKVKFRAWGAGGGGGGTTGTSTAGGSGGGGGGYSEGVQTVTPAGTLTITIGTAGSAGSGAANGTAGSSTSITGGSGTVTCNGGAGGVYATGTSAVYGGTGGSASGGSVNFQGSAGGTGFFYGSGEAQAGVGGGSFGTPPGFNAGCPGGGGVGGANGAAGGNGANGMVILEWLAP